MHAPSTRWRRLAPAALLILLAFGGGAAAAQVAGLAPGW